MRRTAKYKWQDYKTKKIFYQNLKFKNKKKNHHYRNKWVQHGANGQREVATLN
jgi:hypothetical protein